MRASLMMLTFISFSAFACPNLEGQWAGCFDSKGESWGEKDLTITQTGSGNRTIYEVTTTNEISGEITTNSFMADGKTRILEDEESSEMITKVSASCKSMTMTYSMTLENSGEKLAQIQTVFSKSGKNLIQKMSGKILGQNVSETITCRNQ